jgi:endonuclease/exonuclease/phosphatase (EEP) superfamily protein YafD
MNWLLRSTGFFLLLITLLPLVSSGKWYIRWWDFPRLQIAFLLLVPLALAAAGIWKSGFQLENSIWLAILFAGLIWQASHVIPLSPIWATEVANTKKFEASSQMKLMVSNLDFENPTPENVIHELEEEEADVLLLVELDEGWDNRLKPLRSKYAYHHEVVRGQGLGMAIWSRLAIKSAETKYLISDRRPSLWAKIETENGELVNYIGVHPTPPGLLDSTGDTRRDSRVRDAELIMIAKEIASRPNEIWIVAGDFNDVAWSHTTRLFKRTSGLLDPRIGRTFMGTYIANNPFCRCPIDHVFLSKGFTLGSLARKKITGSDHFAILANVALEKPYVGVTPVPQGNDKQDANQIIQEGKEHAEERNVR